MIAETRRLVLREFIDEDLETFFKYRTDPQVFKYQSWNEKFTKEIAKIFIYEMKNINLETENEWMQIALETKSSKTHIGDCAIRRFDNGNQAEVGITIDRLYWKQGYALEGLSALFSLSFTKLNIHRIIGITDTRNIGSIKLLTKLGMRKEGHNLESYQDGDKWTDEFFFAILEHEWKDRKNNL